MKGNHAEIRIFPNKKKSSYGLQKKILTTQRQKKIIKKERHTKVNFKYSIALLVCTHCTRFGSKPTKTHMKIKSTVTTMAHSIKTDLFTTISNIRFNMHAQPHILRRSLFKIENKHT